MTDTRLRMEFLVDWGTLQTFEGDSVYAQLIWRAEETWDCKAEIRGFEQNEKGVLVTLVQCPGKPRWLQAPPPLEPLANGKERENIN